MGPPRLGPVVESGISNRVRNATTRGADSTLGGASVPGEPGLELPVPMETFFDKRLRAPLVELATSFTS